MNNESIDIHSLGKIIKTKQPCFFRVFRVIRGSEFGFLA